MHSKTPEMKPSCIDGDMESFFCDAISHAGGKCAPSGIVETVAIERQPSGMAGRAYRPINQRYEISGSIVDGASALRA